MLFRSVSCEQDPAAIKQALVRQLFSPVRWTETVERMANEGVTLEIEMGPGKVLTGLAKRIDKLTDGKVTSATQRAKLMGQSLAYLDALSREASGDRELQRELATASRNGGIASFGRPDSSRTCPSSSRK